MCVCVVFWCIYILFIHSFMYFWLCWAFVAAWVFFSSWGKWGLLSSGSIGASHCYDFSWGAQALDAWLSVGVAHGLSSCGPQALEHRLSSCGS